MPMALRSALTHPHAHKPDGLIQIKAVAGQGVFHVCLLSVPVPRRNVTARHAEIRVR